MRYRYHWTFKLLALVLAAVSCAVLWLGCGGLILDDLGYYERRRQSQRYSNVDAYCWEAAQAVFDRFAWKDTGIQPELFERFFRWGADVDAVDSLEYDFAYSIYSQEDYTLVDGTTIGHTEDGWTAGNTFDVRRGFVTEMPKAAYYPTYTEFAELELTDLEGEPLPPLGEGVTDYEYYVVSEDESVNRQNISMENYHHEEANGSDYTIYRLEYTGYESYYVQVHMTAEQVASLLDVPMEGEFLPGFLAEHHDALVTMAIWGTIILLLSVLWLALTAGSSPHREEIKPDGLNCIPLDLYLCAGAVGGMLVAAATAGVLDRMVWNSGWGIYTDALIENFLWDAALLALCGVGAGGIVALLTMACAAQMKMGDNYWLKHSCVGIFCRYGWKYGIRAVKWCLQTFKRFFRWIQGACAQTVGFFRQLTMLLPLTSQWLLASGGLWLLMFCCILRALRLGSMSALLFGVLVTVLAVLYGAYCFGILRDAAKKMSEGNLEEKVENQFLLGCFGEFAGHLNALGDACMEAANQRMKSERMKTELITNVSHDIKTPLTSIINYVDLLQKTDDEAQRKTYLEVLDRQSQRLKKLIEDLMDMSKASSGNVAVEITPTDVAEAVSQALGEFADTLEGCGLAVMFRAPAEPVMALCDGKHLWRVLSNCLSNVVKYALSGTRVYVDVTRRGQQVEVSIKNISAQMLGISAEELMERFVRGDSARNTEGSGLGLNIAKSLMELQGGRLNLMVDGDLFKVVLTLNAV